MFEEITHIMEKILFVIKLKDQIRIPDNPPIDLLLGDGFYSAQEVILIDRMALQPNDTHQYDESLFSFFNAYSNLNLNVPLTCLYYLADKKAYAWKMEIVWNFLSYFAFICTEDELANLDLTAILSNDVVDFWWKEGPMLLCNDINDPTLLPINIYYDALDFQGFQQIFQASTVGSGEGICIVDCEDYCEPLQHTYLAAFQADSSRISTFGLSDANTNNKPHFYKTVGILFATLPSPPSSSDENIVGIAPNMQLVAVPFDNVARLSAGDLVINFIARAKVNILDNCRLKSGDILLFERAVAIPMGFGVYRNLPLEVLPDMRMAMQDYNQQGIVVIQPAGQANEVNTATFDLDSAFQTLSNLSISQPHKPTYTDFSDGSVCITVGAWDTYNNNILKCTNTGSIVDVYLWGVGIRTLTAATSEIQPLYPPLFDEYGYTSAASAITAGIVAALQSAAVNSGQILTTTQFKAIFKKTFRANGTKDFESQTLKELWAECIIGQG